MPRLSGISRTCESQNGAPEACVVGRYCLISCQQLNDVGQGGQPGLSPACRVKPGVLHDVHLGNAIVPTSFPAQLPV